jgi:hypothetical protein
VIKVENVKSVMAGFVNQFRAGNGGLIEYEPLKYQRGHFKFTWSPVVTLRKQGVSNQDVTYKVALTKNPRVNLDQICALQRRSDVEFLAVNNQQELQAILQIEPNTET